ncbi:MAG: LysR family transcriptional regulator [gamma proteobacterium endosymbiont of Lamellibrachia anaximandri]|nr:LysR family transcriptional regulator [gamma proteobacterium endosymbiont of Lamellibrachia anaximandri]MBL3617487.1 LysR family transcriptional regulator [gamma proteobacterium endosymbiont of Lamellibrachia anaximandri]
MNLKQLQFAAHVAETHSFSRAAELSFATQPTISNAISQFEEELGGRLFNRTTRKVDLTPFGEYILPRITEVLQSRDELVKAAESYHNPTHKILRIGFSPLVDMQRLDQVLV